MPRYGTMQNEYLASGGHFLQEDVPDADSDALTTWLGPGEGRS